MLSKNQIKYIKSLKLNKFRKKYGYFVAEGNKIVSEIIEKSTFKINKIFATTSWIKEHGEACKNISTQIISNKELQRVSQLKTPHDVLMIVEIPKQKDDIEQVRGIILVLESIRNPGNFGTIIRTADWFGVSQIICSNDCVDAYNSKVIQASMGSIARVQPVYVDLESFLLKNKDKTTIYACCLDGSDLKETVFSEDAMIIIGNEANGISPEIKTISHKKILIPKVKSGGAESLNASIAAAIICYEISYKSN